VVQNSATCGHVLTQLRQVGGDKLEGFLAASRALSFSRCNVCFHVTSGFLDRFDQQFDKLFRAFDAVKWGLCPVCHAVCDLSLPMKVHIRLAHTTITVKTRLE